jgi:hypothetical protein
MTEPIRIDAAALRYVLPHVSKEESRPILNGVLVERCGNIVATGGHTLCVHRDAAQHVAEDVIVRFHRAADVIKLKVSYITLDVSDVAGTGGQWNRTATLHAEHGTPIGVTLYDIVDGPYPAWRHVMPDRTHSSSGTLDGGVLPLDPALVNRFSARDAGPVVLRPTGSSRAVAVTYPQNENVCGLIMPFRAVTDGYIPTWATLPNVARAETTETAETVTA